MFDAEAQNIRIPHCSAKIQLPALLPVQPPADALPQRQRVISQVFVPETHMGDLDWAPASWHWSSLTLVANGKSVCLSVSLYLSSNEKYILKLT